MTDGLRDVGELLGTHPNPVEVHARLGSSSDVRESVCAAIYTALAQPAFEPAVRYAVRLDGDTDTDTVAAMAGAIFAARDGARSIPQRWLAALENGDRGRTHVEELATRLLAKRPTPRAED